MDISETQLSMDKFLTRNDFLYEEMQIMKGCKVQTSLSSPTSIYTRTINVAFLLLISYLVISSVVTLYLVH